METIFEMTDALGVTVSVDRDESGNCRVTKDTYGGSVIRTPWLSPVCAALELGSALILKDRR